uniref:Uncharacterized protein n=1 Tax=Nelumbo nucifera TaxID=4432 RepID=A0A822Y754_NELNU|nr:TPA_asm: hypothetical protein HUJ06_029540 [Nelumbo nucifera]
MGHSAHLLYIENRRTSFSHEDMSSSRELGFPTFAKNITKMVVVYIIE